MKTTSTLLIIGTILIFASISMVSGLYSSPKFSSNLTLGSFLTLLISIMGLGMLRTNIKSSNYLPGHYNLNKFFEIPLNKYFPIPIHVNWKSLLPFLPLVVMAILLLAKPYYLFPTPGDLDFHLMRAREILENPIYGIFYNYMINYPVGQPVAHPPLFHCVLATLWYLGGLRFAHSVLCISQILLSIGIVTWFANKKYGIIAGFFAGIFVLSVPRPDTIYVLMPATYIPILGILTIYFMPKSGKKAAISALLGIWTHMIGIVLFPLLFVSNKKGREYLKNWKISLPIFSSVLFWLAYWTYFTGQPGPHPVPSFYVYGLTYLPGLILLSVLGTVGMILLFKEKKVEFKLFLTYFLSVLILQVVMGDISRGFQYIALPLAILAGLSVQKVYEYIPSYKKRIKTMFLIVMLFIALASGINFVQSPLLWVSDWNQADIPFENKYHGLKEYIGVNTNANEVLGADTTIAFKVAWITGRNVFNEKYGTVNGLNLHSDMNIYQYSDHFSIKDENNVTKKEIPF